MKNAWAAWRGTGQDRYQVVGKEEEKVGCWSPQPSAYASEGAAAAGGCPFPPISRWRGDPLLLPLANGGGGLAFFFASV